MQAIGSSVYPLPYPDQNGERATDFFDVVAWRGTAEFLCKYFEKGRKVVLDGRLQTRSWTDREGHKRVSVEIVAESVYFADSKPVESTFAEVQDENTSKSRKRRAT